MKRKKNSKNPKPKIQSDLCNLPSYPGPRRACATCGRDLSSEVYITCIDCQKIDLCLSCFGEGRETPTHLNKHRFILNTPDFQPGFEDGWSLHEELEFIQSFSRSNSFQWDAIARDMRTKDANQCFEHFKNCYICSSTSPDPRGGDSLNRIPAVIRNNIPVLTPKKPDLNSNAAWYGYNMEKKEYEDHPMDFAEQIISEIVMNSDTESEETFLAKMNQIEAYDAAVLEREETNKSLGKHSSYQNYMLLPSQEKIKTMENNNGNAHHNNSHHSNSYQSHSNYIEKEKKGDRKPKIKNHISLIPDRMFGLILSEKPDLVEKAADLIVKEEKLLNETDLTLNEKGIPSGTNLQTLLFQNLLSLKTDTSKKAADWNSSVPVLENTDIVDNFYYTLLTKSEINFIKTNKISANFFIHVKRKLSSYLINDMEITDEIIEEHFPHNKQNVKLVLDFIGNPHSSKK
ncbi:hypothetical protein TRFO_26324 [Tritrichomonas foetus]|uniref:ZZ-type domain-containing protein n=1 Tax=Tritrichomonas foetus TaxID=1144522 RepID=A0A1J4K8Q7_9EUKA|nr:hypothetical protein TRFO_26324 [Tritrichomonas foetus]|eukprot:OHT05821.1 hypothetical protein TRFO_26324 [Tritrichomonas foetus]